MNAFELAINVVDKYNTYYLDYALIANSSASLSAIRLDRMDDLAGAVRRFVRVSLPLLSDENETRRIFVGLLTHAHWVAQTYRQDQFVDLYDFCDRFIVDYETMRMSHEQLLRDIKPVADACARIKDVICKTEECDKHDGSTVIKSCTVGTKYQYSHGLSLYFPWNKIETNYHPGDPYERPPIWPDRFAKKTGWAQFLDSYITASQRAPRYWPDFDKTTPLGKKIEKLRKDPPEGKGSLTAEPETAKNPPTTWKVSPCVIEPFR
jgi:hypothetical protein